MTVDPWFTDRGIDFSVSYVNPDGPGSLMLTLVPEPGTWAMLLVLAATAGIVGLLRRRRA
jgi:hypothetical protein